MSIQAVRAGAARMAAGARRDPASRSGAIARIGDQLNVSEPHHALARKICFGNRGELKQR